MDEWVKELSDGLDTEDELSEGQQRNLAIEQEEALAIELERDEQRSREKPEPPAKRKLKRELEQEALSRLESAARTVSDWNDVIAWWDRLDANRERRERYHECCAANYLQLLKSDYPQLNKEKSVGLFKI